MRVLQEPVPGNQLRALFQVALQQDLLKQIKHLLCQSLLLPDDPLWLLEQLEDLFRDANRCVGIEGTRHAVEVQYLPNAIVLHDNKRALRLHWTGMCWQLDQKPGCALEEMACALSAWDAFMPDAIRADAA